MAGDLEDFLRRAAERRKQKAQQGGGPPKQAPQEYTDQRTERLPRQAPEEVVVTAEIVEADHTYEARKQQVEQHKKLTQRARAEAAQKQQKLDSANQASRLAKRAKEAKAKAREKAKQAKVTTAAPSTGTPAEELIALLRRPGGMQQAVLLREILDRPIDRW